jgi:hypothetical protein
MAQQSTAASSRVSKWAPPSTPFIARHPVTETPSLNRTDESDRNHLNISTAVAAASAASPQPARRLSAFMRERVAQFTPSPEEPPELDPDKRGHWSPPSRASPEMHPVGYSGGADDNSAGRLHLDEGDTGDQAAQFGSTQASSPDARYDVSSGVPVLHGGEHHPLHVGASPFYGEEDAEVAQFDENAAPAADHSVLFQSTTSSSPSNDGSRVSFGIMPSPNTAKIVSALGVQGSPLAAAQQNDSQVHSSSHSVSQQLSPAYVAHSISSTPGPTSAFTQRLNTPPTTVLSSPAAPTTATTPATFSPSSFFAARSAPLGSLTQPRADERPTFNSPPYATGALPGFMGAHPEPYFVSPRLAGPIFYRPTPGGPHDISFSGQNHAVQRSPGSYSVSATPAQSGAPRAAPASSSVSNGVTPVGSRLFSNLSNAASPMDSAPKTGGISSARASMSSSAAGDMRSPARLSGIASLPSSANRRSSAGSGLGSPPVRTSLTARFGPAQRVPVTPATDDTAAAHLFSDEEPSLPSSPASLVTKDAEEEKMQQPQSHALQSRYSGAGMLRYDASFTSTSVVTSSTTESSARRGSSTHSYTTTISTTSTSTFHVSHSTRLRKLHRYAMFQADPALIAQHHQASDARSIMEALKSRTDAFVESVFPAPAANASSAAGRSAVPAAQLSYHSLKRHASRPDSYTLAMVFDVPPAEAGGAAQSQLDNRQWTSKFEQLMSAVCQRNDAAEEKSQQHAPAPLRISYLEQRPAHWR